MFIVSEAEAVAAVGLWLFFVSGTSVETDGAVYCNRSAIRKIRPSETADLTTAHTGGERKLDSERERRGLCGTSQLHHARALVAVEHCQLFAGNLRRLAEVAGILSDEIECYGVV